MVKTHESERLAEGIVFGEGPRWRDGKLWLSDMYGHRVLTVDPEGKIETVVEVPGRPSGLGWLPDGRLLIVSMGDHRLLRLEADGQLEEHADISEYCGGAANDMVVDSQGRAYVGNVGYNLATESPRTANVVLVEPDGAARIVAEDLTFPNGTVITADGSKMIIAETTGARLSAFDVAADGALSNRRVFAELPGMMPDGICLDAEGAVWASCFGQDEFVRVHEGGQVSERVPVPERRAVACMLGGSDRRTLFLLTAETSQEGLVRGRSTGFIETVQVEVAGAGLP